MIRWLQSIEIEVTTNHCGHTCIDIFCEELCQMWDAMSMRRIGADENIALGITLKGQSVEEAGEA